MKKIILISIILASAFSLAAQVKHNKFATAIKFAKFNPTFQFGGTAVTEIKDQSGYFLSNHYDDQVGGFHPSVVKLDVDGGILLDTIYEFTPNHANGGTQMAWATTSLTSNTILYSTEAISQPSLVISGPYLINTDLNGNINWHVGMADDSMNIEPFKVINTQDGGYAVIGSMEDPQNVEKMAGMIVKFDNAGTLLWDSMYRSTDTLNFLFTEGIETPDGGILVVGDAPLYHNNTDSPMLVAKISSTGSIVWSKVMKLALPVVPTIAPDEITLGMINGTDAFISYEVFDTTGGFFKNPVLTSINVNTGVNNWTKVFSFPGEAELALSTSDGKGNILVHAVDTTDQSLIFRFDDTGNYLGTKSFMTATPVAFNHFPFVTQPTLDGGFIHVNGMNANDVLVVKTDKDLDPSCPAIDSLFPFTLTPVVNLDTSVFGVLDSMFALPNFNTVVLPFGTPFNTVADDSSICSCSNTITGTVLEGGITPVNNAKVFLFKKGIVPKPWSPIDSTITDAGGNYQFNYVPTDSFLVKVNADTALFPGAMTSYFKDPVWCYRWDVAGVFHTHCDSGTVIKDVKLVVPPALTGNSVLSGYIYENTGSFSKNMQPGDPIPGIDITVEQSPGGIVGGSESGGNGGYNLSGLTNNATYVITIDYPGLPHDSVWTVNINLNDSTLDSLNFYIDSTGIYILNQPIGTNVESVSSELTEINVYPNPTQGLFNMGKSLVSRTMNVSKGNNQISIDDVEHLASGIYFLRLKEGQSVFFKKIIKQ
jgi:hypothetical protein